MGLDTVELVMAFEDEFDLAIADADAEKITTPRRVAEYILARRGNPNPTGSEITLCQSQVKFYRLRGLLMREFGLARTALYPDLALQQLMQGDIRQQWRRLQALFGGKGYALPRLCCTRPILWLVALVMPLSLVSVLAMGAPIWLALLLSGVLWLLAYCGASIRLADQLPPGLGTLASLLPYVDIRDRQEWYYDYEAILQRVVQITSDQLGLPVDRIYPDSHFVTDLGAD